MVRSPKKIISTLDTINKQIEVIEKLHSQRIDVSKEYEQINKIWKNINYSQSGTIAEINKKAMEAVNSPYMKELSDTLARAMNTFRSVYGELCIDTLTQSVKTGLGFNPRPLMVRGTKSYAEKVIADSNRKARENAKVLKQNDPIARVYSEHSRVIGKAKGYKSVKMRDGQKGWLSERTGIFSSEQTWLYAFRGADRATGNGIRGMTGLFEGIWLNANARMRGKIVEAFIGFDWEALWETRYNEQSGLIESSAEDAIINIFSSLGLL